MSIDSESDQVRRFENHVLIYVNDLYRAALRLTGRAADAEDLVQDTCLRAFRALDQLRHVAAAKAWVFSILRSTFLRQIERGPHAGAVVSLEDIEGSLLIAGDVVHDAGESFLPTRQALLQETRHAILKLPLAYREAVILTHIGGFSYREISDILGVPVGTVMSRLFRGRRLLRHALHAGGPTRSEMGR